MHEIVAPMLPHNTTEHDLTGIIKPFVLVECVDFEITGNIEHKDAWCNANTKIHCCCIQVVGLPAQMD